MSQRRTTRALKLFILCLAFALVALHYTRVGAQAPQQAGALVEQNHPNIQVLKGLPEAQLIPLMNYISASLGVACDFCHERTRDPKSGIEHVDFAAEGKKEKQTARRMMQMTMGINQANKIDVGNDPVSCYTCHRGSNHPANTPALPLPVPSPPAGGGPGGAGPGRQGTPPSPGAQGGPGTPPAGPGGTPGAAGATPRPTPPPRPSPQQLIDKYIAAVGGRDAVAKVQTRSMKGTRMGLGREQPYEVTIKGADKFQAVVTTPQGGSETQTYSGTTGWLVNAQDRRAMTPEELENLHHAIGIYELIQLGAATPTMRTTRPERVGERLANVITDTPSPGVVEKFYFDQETGLLLRRLRLTSTPIGPIPEQWDFSDYRPVEGVQVPFTIAISTTTPRANSTRKFTDIKFNAPVDDARFQMPAKQ